MSNEKKLLELKGLMMLYNDLEILEHKYKTMEDKKDLTINNYDDILVHLKCTKIGIMAQINKILGL